MNLVAHKKVIFVLVEGPSDDVALGVFLNRIFDKNRVHIEIYYGDITSDFSVKPTDIVSALGDIVRKYADSQHFTQKDFLQVIHIVDMDGAYVPDEAIVESVEADKPIYSLTEIQTNNVEDIVLRNKHKRDKLNRISKLKKVWGSIPYKVYYMSCNLDHVLYGKFNSSDVEKETDAYEFARRYKCDIDGFLDFISSSDFSRMDGYNESWNFIKRELHSLERHTNLGLCFVGMGK